MTEYHKIQSIFKRDPARNNKSFILGDYSVPEFQYLENLDWVGTEKVDGTNVRLFADGRVSGKTDNASLHPNLVSVLNVPSIHLMELSDSGIVPSDTIVFGEGYGSKIQSGGHYIPDGNGFVIFDVMIAGNYQPRESVEDIASKLGLPIVPILDTMSLVEWVEVIRDGKLTESMLHKGARNEGVVLRPLVELRRRNGNRVITKLKFKDFV